MDNIYEIIIDKSITYAIATKDNEWFWFEDMAQLSKSPLAS